MKKLVLAASLSLVVISAFFMMYNSSLKQHGEQASFPSRPAGNSGNHPPNPDETRDYSTEQSLAELEKSVTELESMLANENQGQQPELITRDSHRSSWKIDNETGKTPTIPLSEQVKSYDVVELDGVQNFKPAVGDTVKVPLLDGKAVDVVVSHTHIAPNGDYIWSGHVKGFADSYPVTMTIGKNSAYASITSINGSYSMESVDELGWLYKNPSEAELSTFKKDYLEIPEHARQ